MVDWFFLYFYCWLNSGSHDWCHIFGIFHQSSFSVVSLVLRSLLICIQIWFLLLELSRFTSVLYIRVAWFTVFQIMICLNLFNLPLPQANCFTLLAIYWDSLERLLLPYLIFSYLTSINILTIMAFSPNTRAHASTSRPLQHNWPNPVLRLAANEPPRVVNINGLTITVDRNETHIPVPRPPPPFSQSLPELLPYGQDFWYSCLCYGGSRKMSRQLARPPRYWHH